MQSRPRPLRAAAAPCRGTRCRGAGRARCPPVRPISSSGSRNESSRLNSHSSPSVGVKARSRIHGESASTRTHSCSRPGPRLSPDRSGRSVPSCGSQRWKAASHARTSSRSRARTATSVFSCGRTGPPAAWAAQPPATHHGNGARSSRAATSAGVRPAQRPYSRCHASGSRSSRPGGRGACSVIAQPR
jgi:hypothetical protein